MIVKMAAVVLLLLTLSCVLLPCAAQYKPTWESLDSRPLPAWSVALSSFDVKCMLKLPFTGGGRALFPSFYSFLFFFSSWLFFLFFFLHDSVDVPINEEMTLQRVCVRSEHYVNATDSDR